MKKTKKRTIASILFFALFLSILPPFTAFAAPVFEEDVSAAYIGVSALENTPFCLDEKVVSDAGYTVRLKNLEESDNVAIFSNPDGTAT